MKETKTYAILERENDLLKQENTQLKSDLQKKDADRQYKASLSTYSSWKQASHADEWLLFPENIGTHMSIDET